VGASRALSLGPKLKHDEARATSLRDVLDRSADVFFLTEIFRALWLMTEVAMRPKVTHFLTHSLPHSLPHCRTVALMGLLPCRKSSLTHCFTPSLTHSRTYWISTLPLLTDSLPH
jgi:hypothetical protein